MFKFLYLLSFLSFSPSLYAYTISASSIEVSYSYKAKFKTLSSQVDESDIYNLAENHANHLYGIFHSPEYVGPFDISPELTEGFAGTHYPEVTFAKLIVNEKGFFIEYRVKGVMLVNDRLAKVWFSGKEKAEIQLPLIQDMSAIYDGSFDDVGNLLYRQAWLKKCTDSHYKEPIDFYYFYNPYRESCEKLKEIPLASKVKVFLKKKKLSKAKKNTKVPKKALLGDNGNGEITSFYFVLGYDDSDSLKEDTREEALKKIKRDVSWKSFLSIQKYLQKRYGFKALSSKAAFDNELEFVDGEIQLATPVNMSHPLQRRFYRTYIKKTKKVTYIVRIGLFPTDNKGSLVSFPKFWKEAWENGDFIYFGGHSGSGQSLSLETMLQTLSDKDEDEISFQKEKTQIAFLDSCSSYAHFQRLYTEQQPKLHLVSYGLVSLFELAQVTQNNMIDLLMNKKAIRWKKALLKIEESQLQPMVELSYEKTDVPDMLQWYKARNERPNFLLNVWVP